MFRSVFQFAAVFLLFLGALSQAADDAVRVTVTMNPDGSKTVYQVDGANRTSIATSRGRNGKVEKKIVYKLDGEGRYESGQVFAPDGKLRFKTRYRYNAAGRLAEETQLDKNDAVKGRIVYGYDAEGHQSGYAIYDGEGRLVGRTTPKKAAGSRAR